MEGYWRNWSGPGNFIVSVEAPPYAEPKLNLNSVYEI